MLTVDDIKLALRIDGQVRVNNQRARDLGLNDWLTLTEWVAILTKADGHCYYCGQDVGTRQLYLEHVVPVSRGGPTCAENVVAACKACNDQKFTKIGRAPEGVTPSQPPIPYPPLVLATASPAAPLPLVSTSQAATQLGCSTSAVKGLIRTGQVSAVKSGRDWLIDPAALQTVTVRPVGWPKGRPRKARV